MIQILRLLTQKIIKHIAIEPPLATSSVCNTFFLKLAGVDYMLRCGRTTSNMSGKSSDSFGQILISLAMIIPVLCINKLL